MLRERLDIDDGHADSSTREVTLKLRTPDLFLAAGTPLAAANHEADDKLEEDIGVLLVRTKDRTGEERTAVAEPPSMRSLFSRTVSQPLAAEVTLTSLDDLVDLYPGLDDLDISGEGGDLVQGQLIREWVFEGAEVDLGENLDAEFALTLWFLAGTSNSAPSIAEISFKYKTKDGNVAPEAARRAMTLFLAIRRSSTGPARSGRPRPASGSRGTAAYRNPPGQSACCRLGWTNRPSLHAPRLGPSRNGQRP